MRKKCYPLVDKILNSILRDWKLMLILQNYSAGSYTIGITANKWFKSETYTMGNNATFWIIKYLFNIYVQSKKCLTIDKVMHELK